MVADESLDDTLLDLANYCIMELIERHADFSPAPTQERHVRDIAPKGCPCGRIMRYDDEICNVCERKAVCWAEVEK